MKMNTDSENKISPVAVEREEVKLSSLTNGLTNQPLKTSIRRDQTDNAVLLLILSSFYKMLKDLILVRSKKTKISSYRYSELSQVAATPWLGNVSSHHLFATDWSSVWSSQKFNFYTIKELNEYDINSQFVMPGMSRSFFDFQNNDSIQFSFSYDSTIVNNTIHY